MIKDMRRGDRRTIIFYKNAPNTETLLNWIRDLPPEDRSTLGLDLDFIQSEWRTEDRGQGDAAKADSESAPTDRVGRVTTGLFGGFKRPKRGSPLCRKLDDKIWEMQSAMPSGQITSLLFFIKDSTVHVVSGSIITSNNVPPELLVLARQRMASMQKNVSPIRPA